MSRKGGVRRVICFGCKEGSYKEVVFSVVEC